MVQISGLGSVHSTASTSGPDATLSTEHADNMMMRIDAPTVALRMFVIINILKQEHWTDSLFSLAREPTSIHKLDGIFVRTGGVWSAIRAFE